MEVLCPNVSMDFLGTFSIASSVWLSRVIVEALDGCLLSNDEELFPWRDCEEPVLMESDKDCTLVPPGADGVALSFLLLLLSFDCGGWFLSHVFIMDNPMELLLPVLPPPLPPPAAADASAG